MNISDKEKSDELLKIFETKKQLILQAAKAQETSRALKKQWQCFSIWAKDNKVPGFPCSQAVYEAYFIFLVDKGLKRSSIDQAKWAIDIWHKQNKYPLLSQIPTVKLFFDGIHRSIGFSQNQKRDITIEHIKLLNFQPTLSGLRDKLIFLIGFAGGLRRSELVNLKVEDLSFNGLGMRVNIIKSKTNQEGRGEVVDFIYAKDKNFCPVLTLQEWLLKSQITQGYIFRSFYRSQKIRPGKISDHQIAVIVKKYMTTLGLSKAHYSGHSLRAGCATYLLGKKVPLNVVVKQLRHKRVSTTLRYDRTEVSGALAGIF